MAGVSSTRSHRTTWMTLGVLLVSATGVGAQSIDTDLIAAVRNHNRAALDALLARKVDVNAAAHDGTTALHWAAHQSDVNVVERLLRAGAKVNVADDLGVTPLALACADGDLPIVERLLSAGADPNRSPTTGDTPTMRAALAGNAGVLSALAASGADVNAASGATGQTPLMWAASEGHAEAVRTLVAAGANVNAQSKTGFTPLLFAARVGDRASAEILLRAGADVNYAVPQDRAEKAQTSLGGSIARLPGDTLAGASALLVATVRGHVALAEFFLANGANPNAADAGFTALHWAAGSWESSETGKNGIRAASDHEWSRMAGLSGAEKHSLIKSLLARGANPNARLERLPPRFGFSRINEDGRLHVNLLGATPFLLAALAADPESMQALAGSGADPRLPTLDGTTPLMVAAGLGRVVGETFATEEQGLAAVKLTLELGNDVKAANADGNTALHGAAEARWNSIVRLLVEKGAPRDARNRQGQSPLYIAERTLQLLGTPLIERTPTGDVLRELGARP